MGALKKTLVLVAAVAGLGFAALKAKGGPVPRKRGRKATPIAKQAKAVAKSPAKAATPPATKRRPRRASKARARAS